jgi:voltage-gated potassium channel
MQSQTSSDHPQIRSPLGAVYARIVRASHLIFLVALGLFIVAIPFVEALPGGELVNTMLLTLVLSAGVLVIQARRGTLVLAMLLVVPGVVARWINYFQPELMPAAVHLAFGMLFLALVAVQFLRFILHAPRVTGQVLEAGISTYLVFGLLWTMAYMLVGRLIPGAFAFSAEPGATRSMNASNALYYSFVTLTTMGYGDILPVSRAARMLAILEATTGVLYMSVLIARLVGMYSTVTPIQDKSDTDRSSSDSHD